MFLVGLISWWYGSGWRGQLGRVKDRLIATASFFSIGQLARTLFAPFRQISAGKVNGPFAVVMRGLVDNLISRVIGGIVRLFTIIFGVIALVAQSVFEIVVLALWLVLPLLPVAGLIAMAIGWVPTWM